MPRTTQEVVELLELERLEEDLFRGSQPTSSTLVRVYGGQVAAQALRAASHSVAADRPVHSLHAYFILGGDPTVPIVYDVERIRDGGSFSTRRVSARQHGRVIFYMTASFHVEEPGFEHQDEAPDVGAPEDFPVMADMIADFNPRAGQSWRDEWSSMDLRYAGDTRTPELRELDGRVAVQRVWFRFAGDVPDDRVVNDCLLTYASDLSLLASAVVPHGVLLGSPGMQSASLDHTLWFHRPVRVGEWHLYDQSSPSARGARGLGTARIFAADGSLVATAAQEGLIRRRPKP